MTDPQTIIADRAPALFSATAHMTNLIAYATGRISKSLPNPNGLSQIDIGIPIALMCMHLWTLEQRGAGQTGYGAGGISDEEENGVKIGFEGLIRGEVLTDAGYATTTFGMEFLQWKKENIMGFGSSPTYGSY